MKSVIVDGVKYVEESPTGNRAVIVVDRGWVFAGDVAEADGKITLTRAVWVLRWESIGFDGMIASPKHGNVTLKPMANAVVIPVGSEIFRVPVCDDWGL
jgi:hypothetical protein